MTDYLLVYITFPDTESARDCARMLVRERLAAGANIISGVESVYWWQGQIREHGESLLIAQTTRTAFAKLRDRVQKKHPYAVPCVTAIETTCAHEPFLNWISNECQAE